MTSLSQRLHTATITLFYLLFIATPLIWLPLTSELFEFPKMLFVYSVTSLIVLTWVSRMIIQKRLLIKKTPLDIPILLFFFSQVISTILSIHPRTSLFGYYSRFNGGLLSTISYIILFYAFVSNMNKKTSLKSLTTATVSGILASLYAIPEHFGYSFSCLTIKPHQFNVSCWVQDVQTRIFGTFGQPNWLAAYLATIIPTTWALSLINKKPTVTLILHTVNFLFVTTLLFTRSRSGLMAILFAYALFGLITLIKSSFSLAKPALFITLTLFLPIAIFGTQYTPSLNELISRNFQEATTTSTPPSGTILESGDLAIPALTGGGTESGKIREIVWTGAWNTALAHPFFGTGVETFAYSYYNYRLLEHNLVSEWDFLYNKAHNEFLNLAATTGFFGLFSYLALILSFTILALRHILTKTKKLLSAYRLLVTGSLSGFSALAITNFFGFSTVPTNLLFFLLPAIFLSLTEKTTPLSRPWPRPAGVTVSSADPLKRLSKMKTISTKLSNLQLTLLIVTFFITSYSLFLIGKHLLADTYYSSAKKLEAQGALPTALDDYQRAISLLPGEPTFRNDHSNALSKLALHYANAQDHPKTTQLAQQAFQESATTLRSNPVHLNFYKTQAGVFIRLSVLDPSLLDVAKTILEDAQILAPTDAKISYNLGLIHLDLGNTDTALSYFEQTVRQKANHEGARLELGTLYQQSAETNKAREQYQYILNYIAPTNETARQALDSLPPN